LPLRDVSQTQGLFPATGKHDRNTSRVRLDLKLCDRRERQISRSVFLGCSSTSDAIPTVSTTFSTVLNISYAGIWEVRFIFMPCSLLGQLVRTNAQSLWHQRHAVVIPKSFDLIAARMHVLESSEARISAVIANPSGDISSLRLISILWSPPRYPTFMIPLVLRTH
jgi:hypothetical protein